MECARDARAGGWQVALEVIMALGPGRGRREGGGKTGRCSGGWGDVFSFLPNVFSFRANVFTFRPNVFTLAGEVFTLAGEVFSEEGER